GDAQVLFTSALDNTATTSYFDPLTQVRTTIVPAIDSLNSGGAKQPTPGNVPTDARWGSITLQSGSFGILDEAQVRHTGPFLPLQPGSVGLLADAHARHVGRFLNVAGGTITQNVVSFVGASAGLFRFLGGLGTRYMLTNNDFFDNADAPLGIEGNGLLAADPT